MEVKITVNGKVISDHVDADLSLLDFLRKHGCYSVKCGCETTNCGLCTVLMDGTPIYDIKPYIPYADCRPEATDGFAPKPEISLEVRYAEGCREKLREPEVVTALLQQDPRPHYQDDPERIYGLTYEKQNVCFTVKEGVVFI